MNKRTVNNWLASLCTMVLVVYSACTDSQGNVDEWETGDLVFQTSSSRQSLAIQLATHSEFSHVGMVYERNGDWFVYEAVQPVKSTPLKEWLDRGENGSFVAKRLKESENVWNEEHLKKLFVEMSKHEGKDYDLYFNWSDEQMYCSELVWKLYQTAAGIELSGLRPLEQYDLQSDLVQEILNQRYGLEWPLKEQMVSPQDVFDSDLLIRVHPPAPFKG